MRALDYNKCFADFVLSVSARHIIAADPKSFVLRSCVWLAILMRLLLWFCFCIRQRNGTERGGLGVGNLVDVFILKRHITDIVVQGI